MNFVYKKQSNPPPKKGEVQSVFVFSPRGKCVKAALKAFTVAKSCEVMMALSGKRKVLRGGRRWRRLPTCQETIKEAVSYKVGFIIIGS